MAHRVPCSLLGDMWPQLWFLLADETRDVSNREQLVVCIRWVSESYKDAVGMRILQLRPYTKL